MSKAIRCHPHRPLAPPQATPAAPPFPVMDVRQLSYFVGVAEDLHFGRAASRLHIAQPSLTRQVQQLERRLGVRLLERDKRRVQLTKAGLALLQEARRILTMTHRAQWIVKSVGTRPAGALRVGFSEPLMRFANDLVVRGIVEPGPSVQPELLKMTGQEQLDALRSEELDVGLIVEAAGSQRPDGLFDHLDLWEDELVLLMSPSNELAHKKEITRADLKAQQYVVFSRPENPSVYDAVVKMLKSWGVSREPIVVEARNIVATVATGSGIAFTASRRAGGFASMLIARTASEALPKVSAVLVWRKPDMRPPLRWFLEMVKAVIDAGPILGSDLC